MTEQAMEIGLYGKLPSHGDFLRRRVPDEFIGVWDAWLQQCIAASRNALGERWLDIYLTSPAWRFICDAGVCGSHSYAGVMVPSVDRVGRYFPLTLMWQVPEGVTPFAVARRAEHWFDAAERATIEVLATEQVDFEKFDAQVVALMDMLANIRWQSAVELDAAQAARFMRTADGCWQFPIGTPPAWEAICEQLLGAQLRTTYRPLSLFWTEGSVAIEPSCLMLQGLPAPHRYSALLDGSWQEHDWSCIAAQVAEPPSFDETLVDDSLMLNFRSAALSDAGRLRSSNQDAFLERPEIGLWAVADGMGGHSAGDVASRMVCDALAEMVPAATLDASVGSVQECLQRVNAYLQRVATRLTNPVQSGSTVVALLIRGDRVAVMWAGDSRIYRLRTQRLEQLTSDHSWANIEGADGGALNSITRAVGGEEHLDIEVRYDRVQPGDRYLLCSDGLTHELEDERIAQLLGQYSVDQCVSELVGAALQSGGGDNVTVVVVEASD